MIGWEDGLTQVTWSYCIVQGRTYRMRSPDERLRDEEQTGGTALDRNEARGTDYALKTIR
jgi:hypothetical protein